MDIFQTPPFDPIPLIPKLSQLNRHQQQLVHFLVECRKRKDIAAFYRISSKGLEWHIYRVFEAVGVGSITELVILATKADFKYAGNGHPEPETPPASVKALRTRFQKHPSSHPKFEPIAVSMRLCAPPTRLLLAFPMPKPETPKALPAKAAPAPAPVATPKVKAVVPKPIVILPPKPTPTPMRTSRAEAKGVRWIAHYIEDCIETDCVNARVPNRLSYWTTKLRRGEIEGDDLMQLHGVITMFGRRLNKNYGACLGAIIDLQNTGCKTQPHEQRMVS